MRTIGRHWPGSAPSGDYPAICDYCGVKWRRSQLRRDRAGKLYCPDEGSGRDAVTLAQGNARGAAAAAAKHGNRRPPDGRSKGEYDP